jgi:hypothetical protein
MKLSQVYPGTGNANYRKSLPFWKHIHRYIEMSRVDGLVT